MTDTTRFPAIGLLLDDEAVLEAVAPRSTGVGTTARAALARLVAHGVSFVVLGHRDPSSPRRVEPSVAAGEVARLHRDLGVVVAADPDRDHPYNLARRLLSIDSLTGGFAGLLLDPAPVATPHARQTHWAGDVTRDDVAEYADLVTTLWGTFARESLVGDRATGLFARSELLRRADHEGRWPVRGGLGTPSSVQGLPPVLWWAVDPSRGGGDVPAQADAAIVRHLSQTPVLPEYLLTDVAGVRRDLSTVSDGVVVRLRSGEWAAAVEAVLEARPASTAPPAPSLRAALGLPPRSADISGLSPAFPAAAPTPQGVRS
ncbi:hypothetical protein GCM10025867_42470 [Frondihabitans sucicola]|uniref:LLM class flavin-dependent oxidoreductase n=1 Tax=Frondihabitans sucicola TaxID=1268041 RepID=A0ABM8GU84_9MICO|nr:hypothetical protein [Frondihabitans sucicola]BDZ52006.1 hypothetical protein GCM10025867_42470 [Frondihabitans sucicola]